jgi:hypothetical protein
VQLRERVKGVAPAFHYVPSFKPIPHSQAAFENSGHRKSGAHAERGSVGTVGTTWQNPLLDTHEKALAQALLHRTVTLSKSCKPR